MARRSSQPPGAPDQVSRTGAVTFAAYRTRRAMRRMARTAHCRRGFLLWSHGIRHIVAPPNKASPLPSGPWLIGHLVRAALRRSMILSRNHSKEVCRDPDIACTCSSRRRVRVGWLPGYVNSRAVQTGELRDGRLQLRSLLRKARQRSGRDRSWQLDDGRPLLATPHNG